MNPKTPTTIPIIKAIFPPPLVVLEAVEFEGGAGVGELGLGGGAPGGTTACGVVGATYLSMIE